MNNFMKASAVFLATLLIIVLLTTITDNAASRTVEKLTYGEFLQAVKDDRVKALDVTEYRAVGVYSDTDLPDSAFPQRHDFQVEIVNSIAMLHEDLRVITAQLEGVTPDQISSADYHFKLSNSPLPVTPWWITTLLPLIVMFILLGVFWALLMRSNSGGSNKMMSFNKSRARMYDRRQSPITFKMVAGADEEKEELAEIVQFLLFPKRYSQLGARIPKGVLLVGPPGTGKTYLARAVAGEANVPYLSISGSDFVEMFVGVGASRVRDLFTEAKKNAPCIVFIDEIDAVGRQRGAGLGGGHDEREQTLNQLLVEMDGFTLNEGVIVIAATNRPDILDPALLRPGRFDRQITVNLPDIKGREAVLRVHAEGKPLADDVELYKVAQQTSYFSPADLENVLNEAAILAARREKDKITMAEIEYAITRVMLGPEKRSKVVSERDKKLVAYHEAGHAIVAYNSPHSMKVHEISIIPRAQAGGYNLYLPSEETRFMTKPKMMTQIAVSMGGRVAEQIMLGEVSTGASDDIKRATGVARAMVTQYGMTDEIGMVYLGGDQEIFIGKDLGHATNYSEQMAARIDTQIKSILDDSYNAAMGILTAAIDKLEAVASALIEREKLDYVELQRIMGYPPVNKQEWDKVPEWTSGKAATGALM